MPGLFHPYYLIAFHSPLPVFCSPLATAYLCRMDNDMQQILDWLADAEKLSLDVRQILDRLVEQAKQGDTEAVKQLRDILRQANEEQLRKELFGV